ncbi:LysR family transcriptional regulator [Ectopseudomonas composti]|uniref:LysR family transcriptional regulator n=1 Tax=Ectopseudomonas composti TaxID=658457 RepID=A0ABN0S703_9GAMM|nr:LysR family transcriptional regulator [Pseudomonas composti]
MRIIKTLSECANRSATAKKLGINVSTVSRRVAQVEKALGVALFDHRKSGYMLTAEGVELRALSERVELDIVSVTRRISKANQGTLGKLRITTSDSLLLYFLTPIIADFKAQNEGVAIEVLVGNQTLSLARDESDIAVRATRKPSESLVGRRLATIAWAPYGSIANAPSSPLFSDDQTWVSYSAGLSDLRATSYVESRVAANNIAYRTDSVAAASVAIAAGLGLGFLPCMLGDITPGLVRVGPVVAELNDELWLLTHQDIRKSRRVQAFMAFCAAAVAEQKALVEGQLTLPVT